MHRIFSVCLITLFLVSCGNNSQLVADPFTPDFDNSPLQETLETTDETPEGGQEQTISVSFAGSDGPIDIVVTVIDGIAVFEGDIVLGEIESLNTQGAAVSQKNRLWPEAKIPVKISFSKDSEMYKRIVRAIRYVEARTPLDFVPYTNQADYILFTTPDPNKAALGLNCYSKFGRVGGEQSINLGSNCKAGTIVHEIGHAIGLFHEQSRSDRSSHIDIFPNNIMTIGKSQFKKHSQVGIPSKDIGSYDLDSIMHYSAKAFKKPGLVCTNENKSGCSIVPKGNIDINRIGQRKKLSEGDIATINALYNSNALPTIVAFTATPDNGPGPLTTTFSWSVSDEDAADLLSCSLDTNSDGTADYTFENCQTSSSQTHTYTVLDAHQATLTLKDGKVEVTKSIFVTVELLENEPPQVEAGADQTVIAPASASLLGIVTDDGLPEPPAKFTVAWSKVSGPGSVSFTETKAASTQVSFSQAGTYVFQLTANDGERTSSDRVTVIVEGTPSEICGDGIDNDGDDQIDEDCDFERSIFVDDNQCEDDLIGVAVDGKDLGQTPRGKGRFYDVSDLKDGEHSLVITALNSGGKDYGCDPNPIVSYGVTLSEGITFLSKNGNSFKLNRDSTELNEGNSNSYIFKLGTNPIITVENATFTENVTGALSQIQFTTTLSLTIDFEKASITGSLAGRSLSQEDVRCFLQDNPDVTIDLATYEYTDSYAATLATSFDPENKIFSIPLAIKGTTTATLMTPFDDERCISLNDDPAPGLGPWSGEGAISGEVLKDGSVLVITDWDWAGSSASGTWEGKGTVQ